MGKASIISPSYEREESHQHLTKKERKEGRSQEEEKEEMIDGER